MARGYLPAPHPGDMTNAPSDIAVAEATGLARSGHDVTFFGPKGTRLPLVKVRSAGLPAMVHGLRDLGAILEAESKSSHNLLGLWDQYLAYDMLMRASRGEFDVLHFHHPEAALPFARLFPEVPVVYTIHDPIDHWFREALTRYGSPNQFVVSISDKQREPAPKLPYLATTHNGIDTRLFSYCDEGEDYLLFCGRITAEKGVREAIEVARRTGARLYIVGAVYDGQRHYFETQVRPFLNDRIQYLGFMERTAIVELYQKARVLLFPVQWEEPFGLTMIEAMACGTPVIATPRGSVPEVVRDGVTGYIRRDIDEMAEAVGRVDQLRRSDCRTFALRQFSNTVMVKNYGAALARASAILHPPKTLVVKPKPLIPKPALNWHI